MIQIFIKSSTLLPSKYRELFPEIIELQLRIISCKLLLSLTCFNIYTYSMYFTVVTMMAFTNTQQFHPVLNDKSSTVHVPVHYNLCK